MYTLRIKKYRKLKNLTQKQLANSIGLSQNFFSEVENGKYDIRLSMLCKIARELNVSPKSLFEYKRKCKNQCK